ncbi:MAG: hypothetical protein HC826_01085 [Rhodospirillales bacterium]|nr:hypothetical protein [Rhodospirillales bacterium]
MAQAQAQERWRQKNYLIKTQLNVMARRHTHDTLGRIAADYDLRGKGEAVAFACFVVRALAQRAEYNPEAAQMLRDFADGYHRDRDFYAA